MMSRIFFVLCVCAALLPLAPHAPSVARADVNANFPGWPREFENRPLQALPLTPAEQAFQTDFPGKIGRFSDGKREIILRWINHSSRRLHPALDCFKANGYQVQPQALQNREGQQWSSFEAQRGQDKLQVFERIYDAHGQQWSDVSAWYWATQLGKTAGPWWAVTVAQKI